MRSAPGLGPVRGALDPPRVKAQYNSRGILAATACLWGIGGFSYLDKRQAGQGEGGRRTITPAEAGRVPCPASMRHGAPLPPMPSTPRCAGGDSHDAPGVGLDGRPSLAVMWVRMPLVAGAQCPALPDVGFVSRGAVPECRRRQQALGASRGRGAMLGHVGCGVRLKRCPHGLDVGVGHWTGWSASRGQ